MRGRFSVATLRDVVDLNPALDESPPVDELVSFLPMSAVDARRIDAVDTELRRFGDVCKGYTPFVRDDVLVAKITPCFENGKIAQAKTSRPLGFGSTEFHVLRPDPEKLDPRFLVHFLRQDRIRLEGERKMTGSAGQRRVPEHFLADHGIPLPPLPEQRRIADILDKADALRAKRRAALAHLDALTQSIFHDMFGDPATNPKGWRRVPFSELLARIDSGWSPQCLNRPAHQGEWGILKLGAVTRCEYDPNANKALPHHLEPPSELEVQPGDLLFARKNTYELVAACALVKDTPPKRLLPDLVFRLKTLPRAPIEKSYLQQLLVYPTKRINVQRLAGGSAGSMPNISKGRLLNLQIELPPIADQQAFGRKVAIVDQYRSVWRASLARLESLFAALQHRAFRGEL